MDSGYASHDSAGWVEHSTKQTLSPLGREVAEVLSTVAGGVYNAPINHDRVDWANTYYIRIVWRGEMANWDGPQLAILLAECSRRLLRVSIGPCNMQGIELMFHQRVGRTGGTMDRLPEIREILDTVDGWYADKSEGSGNRGSGGEP